MRCLIEMNWTEFPARTEALFNAWQSEHESYYGRPHGASFVDRPARLVELGADARGSRGMLRVDGGFAWLRSSGNWAAVYQAGGEWFVEVDSARHGIPPGVADLFSGLVYRTDSPEGWWEDGDGVPMAHLRHIDSQARYLCDPLGPVPWPVRVEIMARDPAVRSALARAGVSVGRAKEMPEEILQDLLEEAGMSQS